MRDRRDLSVLSTSPVGSRVRVSLRLYGETMAELEELQAQLLELKEKQAAAEKQIAELEEQNKALGSDLTDARAINKKLILSTTSRTAGEETSDPEEETDDRDPQEIFDEEVMRATDEHVGKAIDMICGRKPVENGQRTSGARPHQR